MQKTKSLLTTLVPGILLCLSFNSCAKKQQIIFKIKYLCEKQEVYSKPTAKLRVANKDVGVAKAFIKANNYTYKAYEKQVLKHNEACKKLKEKKEKQWQKKK